MTDFFDRMNRIAELCGLIWLDRIQDSSLKLSLRELGENGVWWIDMEPAVTDSRYRGR